jgi:hypothetical protein
MISFARIDGSQSVTISKYRLGITLTGYPPRESAIAHQFIMGLFRNVFEVCSSLRLSRLDFTRNQIRASDTVL